MALYTFVTPIVEEAPLLWEVPLDRYRMDRGVSIGEVAPNVWEAARFWSYTDQNAILRAGLRFYQGGHEYIVDDSTRAELIAYPGLGITASNFTPYP